MLEGIRSWIVRTSVQYVSMYGYGVTTQQLFLYYLANDHKITYMYDLLDLGDILL